MNGGRDCYPESDVLINKYNICEKELLEKFEIQKVFVKLLGLDVKPARIRYTYDVEHLVKIHKYLYGDIYPMCRKTPCFSYGDIRHVHRIYASN